MSLVSHISKASIKVYAIPPAAAMVSIVPVFAGFELKSRLQLGKPMPRLTWQAIKGTTLQSIKKVGIKKLSGGCSAAPSLGFSIFLQNTTERVFEKYAFNGTEPSFTAKFAVSAFVGLITTPALAVFNARSNNKTVSDALRNLSLKQTATIVARETSFLFSVSISDEVCNRMRKIFGENRALDAGSSFTTGVIGSLGGHMADTALTQLQNDKSFKIVKSIKTNPALLWRGAVVRAITIGIFNTFYFFSKQWMNRL